MLLIEVMRLKTISAVSVITFAAILVAACSSTPPGANPHDMSADEHREHAAAHDAQADSHEGKHDPNLLVESNSAGGDSFSVASYNPTDFHRELAVEHKGHADAHRAAAAKLESFEAQECGRFPPATRKECPLLGTMASIDKIDKGATLHFKPKVNTKAALAHVKCHLAFAATEGFKGMDACPLYVKGATVSALPNGDLNLTVEDAKLVTAVQQRAASHVSP